eukprot:gene3745-4153_t
MEDPVGLELQIVRFLDTIVAALPLRCSPRPALLPTDQLLNHWLLVRKPARRYPCLHDGCLQACHPRAPHLYPPLPTAVAGTRTCERHAKVAAAPNGLKGTIQQSVAPGGPPVSLAMYLDTLRQ